MTARRLALAALLLAAAPALADEVNLRPDAALKVPGGRLTGQIQAETTDVVQIKPATGPARDIPVDQIDSVGYTGQPASLPLAETREAAGALDEAIDQYKKAAAEASGKPYILQAARFGAARSLAVLAQGDPRRADEAIAALEAIVQEFPRGRHVGPALELLARTSLARQDFDRAAAALDRLAKLPWAGDRAAVLQARVRAAQGQADAALEALDGVLTKAEPGSARANEARLVRAEVLAAAKRFPEAEAAVREVIAAAPPEAAELQALAHNTLGDCLGAAGRPKDALFAYLHTDILYDRDREQHARALAKIAELWRLLDRSDRADEALARLRERYPRSPYAAAK